MVHSIHLPLLELLQMAETPLYSAYRTLGRQLGHQLSLPGFLEVLDGLLEEDAVRLWEVDAAEKKKRWSKIPADLAQRYLAINELDDSFDPFDLTLTIGPTADLDASPQWEADLDFKDGRFALEGISVEAVGDAEEKLKRLFPEVDFVRRQRFDRRDGVRVEGSVL